MTFIEITVCLENFATVAALKQRTSQHYQENMFLKKDINLKSLLFQNFGQWLYSLCSRGQTWKKLQAALADILLEIMLFWGLFESNIPSFLTEDGARRDKDWEMRLDQWKIEDGGLWIENRPTRFQDFIMPHQYSIHIFLFIHCRKIRYFEDIVELWIFRLRTIYNFFQVCLQSTFAKQVFYFNYFVYENLKNHKRPPGGQNIADGIWKGLYPLISEIHSQAVKHWQHSLWGTVSTDLKQKKRTESCSPATTIPSPPHT